jgi:Cd2+/Zn2+-exporting ATPase
MGRLHAIAFDKTGTLTKGFPEVTDLTTNGEVSEEDLVKVAASIEANSAHPLARAIMSYASKINVSYESVENFQSITGKGIEATLQGDPVSIGSIKWANEKTSITDTVQEEIAHLQSQGKSVMIILRKNVYIGHLAVADDVRSSSGTIIAQLKQLGIKHVIMLTGDHPTTANAIAKTVDVTDVRAGLMPEDKLTAIKSLIVERGRVAMVGDGMNDAPALAAASVGIAMGGAGTDAALETADVALMADDLEKLPYTIQLSRKALRIIKENIMFALGLKIIALLLIIPGLLTLWIAIFADMGATLLVVLNSMRLLKIQK